MSRHLETLQKEEITHTQIVRYAGASGDFNPIHTVVPFAQEAGLGDVIAHGMMIMGFVGQAIDGWFPTDQLENFTARFKAMTRPGEKIIVNGCVTNDIGDWLHCVATAANEAGEVKVEAKFTIRIQ
ncbi:3-hydroxyacyl-ACP dehydratase (plasmid) [Sporosarcina sp. P37]|uniref:MaoC/PaaZ C-terminal domain-containing protein n=1 Tax=unclassified Sporosarcina TaxID=2647733 RepID=UPI000A17A710|nr:MULTISPECIES: MaoC/PaaZ C-terminal domain-containing protein [unclassified Sporosarcina]ARK26429.1 3-hydroxyacyl-ACP dehydratase [Sporosarcina sp. P37]